MRQQEIEGESLDASFVEGAWRRQPVVILIENPSPAQACADAFEEIGVRADAQSGVDVRVRLSLLV